MLRLYGRAPVAQVDRAAGFEPVGREFESLRARQKVQALPHFFMKPDDMKGQQQAHPCCARKKPKTEKADRPRAGPPDERKIQNVYFKANCRLRAPSDVLTTPVVTLLV